MRRDLFSLPPGIYLDGNSLGLMPHAAREAVLRRLTEWETLAVSGWDAWFGLAESLSPSLARLVGAREHEVIATGSTRHACVELATGKPRRVPEELGARVLGGQP